MSQREDYYKETMLLWKLQWEADQQHRLAGIPKPKKIKQSTPRPTIKRFNTMGRGRR